MDRGVSPPLAEILAFLARDKVTTRNRAERAAVRLQLARKSPTLEFNGRTVEEVDRDADALADAYDDHPFDGAVQWASERTAIPFDKLVAAASARFEGYYDEFARLGQLDVPVGTSNAPATLELFSKLRQHHPAVADRFARTRGQDAYSDCRGLIDRLLAGPDDVELSRRELALLEAYLKQSLSLAQIRCEAKEAEGESESALRGNKLKRIRDFNCKLGATTAASGVAPANPVPGPDAESAPDAPTGFMGGAALADVLGIHATRRNAFFRRLGRYRIRLGDDCWHEVREPRPNSPRFLYLVDSPKLRDLATAYTTPKLA